MRGNVKDKDRKEERMKARKGQRQGRKIKTR